MTDITDNGEAQASTEEIVTSEIQADDTSTTGQEANSGDDAAAAAGEGEGTEGAETGADGQPKSKKTAQERINEVTAARREAEREADEAKRRAEYWESVARNGAKPAEVAQEAQPQADERPNPEAYAEGIYDPSYIEDLTGWKAEQAVAKRFEERAREDAAASEARSFDDRAAKFAEQNPDYQAVVVDGAKRNAWACTPAMNDAIKTSDVGPSVAYHLAKNPDDARRIAALPPISQVREIGRLEARFEAKAEEPAPKPTPKTATDAPPPTPQARGTAGRFAVDPATNDFAAFEQRLFQPSRNGG